MNKEWKNLNKPVGYVRVYAKNLLEKDNTQTVINSHQQDVDDLPLYSEATVIGLMKSAYYDGYTEREKEFREEGTVVQNEVPIGGWAHICKDGERHTTLENRCLLCNARYEDF